MYDQQLFFETLSRCAVVLPARYDLEATLGELAKSVVAVLDLSGSGVTIAEKGRLHFVTDRGQSRFGGSGAEPGEVAGRPMPGGL